MRPQTSVRTGAPSCWRVAFAVGVALLAHLVIVAHDISHVWDASVESGAARHCLVCSASAHTPAIPVARSAACAQGSVRLAGCDTAQAPATCFVDSAVCARAPPLHAEPVSIG